MYQIVSNYVYYFCTVKLRVPFKLQYQLQVPYFQKTFLQQAKV